jgi:hypothetical protein
MASGSSSEAFGLACVVLENSSCCGQLLMRKGKTNQICGHRSKKEIAKTSSSCSEEINS